ncbi:MAG: succinate dehydrogenase, cytochrome b subunit [Proteobacteria bacterium]|nr:succinate dehydrogenase, cytochrome b subunit [Pseudomonadota bacterium]
MKPHNARYRRDPLWLAAMLHRLSGIGLALFLPMHFMALALSLEGAARLDRFLRWTDQPLFRVAETVLIGLLAVHLVGGLRIMAIENLPWRPAQKEMAFAGVAVAALVAAAYLARLV